MRQTSTYVAWYVHGHSDFAVTTVAFPVKWQSGACSRCSLFLGAILCIVCSSECVTVHALPYGGQWVTVCIVCFLLDELPSIYTDQPWCPTVTELVTAELLDFIEDCTSSGSSS